MVGRNVLVAVAAMTGPAAVRWWFGVDPEVPLVALAIAAVLAGLGWMVGLVVVAHPLVGELVMLVRRVAPRAPLKWVERRVRAHG